MAEQLYVIEYPEGDKVSVSSNGVTISISEYTTQFDTLNEVDLTRDEAIAAAKAILSHYGIAYQVGEEVW